MGLRGIISFVCVVALISSVFCGCSDNKGGSSTTTSSGVSSGLTTDAFISVLDKSRTSIVKSAGGELNTISNSSFDVSYKGVKLFGHTGMLTANLDKNERCVRLTFSYSDTNTNNLANDYKQLDDSVKKRYGLQETLPIGVYLGSSSTAKQTKGSDLSFNKDVLTGQYQLQKIYQENVPTRYGNVWFATTVMNDKEYGAQTRVMVAYKDRQPNYAAEKNDNTSSAINTTSHVNSGTKVTSAVKKK